MSDIKPTKGYGEDDGSTLPNVTALPRGHVKGCGLVELKGGGTMVVLDVEFRGEAIAVPLDDEDTSAIAAMSAYRRSLLT